MTRMINSFVALPDTKIDLLIKLLNQNDGKLSKYKRQKKFEELSDEEVSAIEESYHSIYFD